LQTQGAIFHHKRLVFHNGFVGKKYLILLNTPGKGEPCLFVKTTSQKKNKPARPGCIKERSLFFVPSGKTFFKLDTWVQLYEIYPIAQEDVAKDKNISSVGEIGSKFTDDIVNCLFEAEEENISQVFKRMLRPSIQEALLKLKAKFNG